MEYKEYLKTPHWKSLKQERLKREPRCRVCGFNKQRFLTAHHLVYKDNLEEVTVDETMTLCRHCHETAHFLKKIGVLKFNNTSSRHRRMRIYTYVRWYYEISKLPSAEFQQIITDIRRVHV